MKQPCLDFDDDEDEDDEDVDGSAGGLGMLGNGSHGLKNVAGSGHRVQLLKPKLNQQTDDDD